MDKQGEWTDRQNREQWQLERQQADDVDTLCPNCSGPASDSTRLCVDCVREGFVVDVCRYCGEPCGYAQPHALRRLCSQPSCQRRARSVGERRARRHFSRGGAR